MAIGLKMSVKLSQQLKLTPQLQQAVKLLQLSRMELENEVHKELIENPALEEVLDTMEESKDSSYEEHTSSHSTLSEQDEKEGNKDLKSQEDIDWDNYLENQYKPNQQKVSDPHSDQGNYENIVSSPKTLKDHLEWQINLGGFNEEEKKILFILINYINDNGYLSSPLEKIAQEENLKISELESILPFLHELDPPGVGARDLKECLLVQARHLEEDTKELVEIIEKYLSELEQKNYKAIAKAMNLDFEIVVDLCQIILGMEPKPGRSFSSTHTHFITPDVYVHKVDGKYVISLNEEGLPRLRVSSLYRNLLKSDLKDKGGKEGKETKEYIKEKLNSAVWFIKSIQQRQKTIYKVAESVMRYQEDFLEKGLQNIKPLVLKDVADDIEMHESTVCRVTANKYIHTPRGIFELKYFFNPGLRKVDGELIASESVKLKVKEFIKKEDFRTPLSDQDLVNLLAQDGIHIARRTIAKYREALGILPSSRRKKYHP